MSQKKKTAGKPQEKDTREESPKASVTEKGEELTENMDKLIDEIDDVLEKNAEEFVKNYVQKGGQ